MESRWHDKDAEEIVARYAAQDVGRDLALRVYTSRLLGSDPITTAPVLSPEFPRYR